MGNEGRFDGLIVGQGLAGTCLAFEFLRRKKTFKIMDIGAGHHSSAVAAGTFNPVSFRTHSTVWMAEILVPYLRLFYNELGSLLNHRLVTERPVYRRFRNPDQRKAWEEALSKNPEMTSFMDGDLVEEISGVKTGFGFGVVKNAGTVHLEDLLRSFRLFLKNEGLLIEGNLNPDDIVSGESSLNYKGGQFENLLLCQGHQVNLEQGFARQPFRKTKGEVLIIEAPGLEENGIVHDGINLVPFGQHRFWVGSTFRWNDSTTEPTAEVREELEGKLRTILDVPWKVIEQRAGIRPTVIDRRPVIGRLPGQPRRILFNGLGTRGVMLAPYFAGHLCDHLFLGAELQKEVNINRFF